MSRLLLVEDSEECQAMVSRALQNSGIELTITGELKQTLECVKKNGAKFDLAILDLSLPDGDGFAVLDLLREHGMAKETPVFFLTSEVELGSKVLAFNLGADDYLVKPISPVELRARIEMRLRKKNSSIPESILKGDLKIDLMSFRAMRSVNKESIDLSLTAKEFKILAFLMQSENKVFSRSEMVEAVWGAGLHVLDRTVDSHIYGLRKKMGPVADYIESIPSVGYRFKGPTIARQ